ncbi:hypothetical protein B0T19DRAFT_403430 [Cercophora scortea]|uniref:Uncharacterized protein n=1 Tax=Cercophora scortea TaxID=314031 RepID=A0AAE0M6H1_9PEZI|nr:hypothetical protein B0T19DRAFT_403430 [Cercophora scortea]
MAMSTADLTTSIVDLMSSPDPLNESTPNSALPSSRRVTRSQTSQRFFMTSSPKKQTFELDVGSEIAPQKLLVTVEAEDSGITRGVTRRLFHHHRPQPSPSQMMSYSYQSPTPRRGATRRVVDPNATTTIVPLRGLTDDEMGGRSDAPTPRRRGRPPKSGTPVAATKKRGRPPTPARTAQSSIDILTSDINEDNQATPRAATSQPRRAPKRKSSATPLKDNDTPGTQQRKRGRPRKQVAVPEEAAGALSEQESTADAEVEDNVSVAAAEDHHVLPARQDERPPQPPQYQNSAAAYESEEDIWLATLSDQLTPIARRYAEPEPAPEPEGRRSEEDDQQRDEYLDIGGGMGSHSDADTSEGEDHALRGGDAQETMTGEEFTMIDLGSLISMQPNSSMMAPVQQGELGDETSFIIHRTMEALRQSLNKPAQDDARAPTADADAEDAGEVSLIQEPRNDVDLGHEQEHEQEQEQRQEQEREQERTQQQEQQQAPSQEQRPSLFSQPSPQSWNRSPRRTRPQPLAQQLAHKNLYQRDELDLPERLPTPSSTEQQETNAYEDSFSEIPEEVLVAATPRRVRQPQPEAERDDAAPDIQPSIERPSTVNPSNPQSESNRLLTPDETPSPIPTDDGEEEEEEREEARAQSKSPAAASDYEVRSSPPVSSHGIHRGRNGSFVRHSRSKSMETPADQLASFVSPALAALNNAHAINLPPPESLPRPTLSPIVRVGRALQLVTSDPPSPPGRDSVLRSPFRGSVPKSSQSPGPSAAAPDAESAPLIEVEPAPQPRERSWLAPLSQIKNYVVQGAQALSPKRPAPPQMDMDDPFSVNNAEPERPSSARNSIFSFGSRRAREEAIVEEEDEEHEEEEQEQDAAAGITSSTRANSLRDEDEISWRDEVYAVQQEGRLQVIGGAVSSYGAELMRCLRESDQEMDEREDQDMEEQEQEQDQEQDEEEDEDIWAIEAQRPTPFSKKAPSRREPVAEPSRTDQIPSPWRQRNSERLALDEEPRDLPEKDTPAPEMDDFSMLSRQSRGEKTAVPPKPAPASKADLSAFFSSPAVLPEAAPSLGYFKALNAQRYEKTNLGRGLGLERFKAAATGQSQQTLERLLSNQQPPPRPQEQEHEPRPIVPQRESRVQEQSQRYQTGERTSSSSQKPQPRVQKLGPSVPKQDFRLPRQQPFVPRDQVQIQSQRATIQEQEPEIQNPRSTIPEKEFHIQNPRPYISQKEFQIQDHSLDRRTTQRSLFTQQPQPQPQPRTTEQRPHLPQKEFRVQESHRSVNLFNVAGHAASEETELMSSSPPLATAEDEAVFQPIPQKRNFTPRRRAGNSLFQPPAPKPTAPAAANSLFGNPRVSTFLSAAPAQVPAQDELMEPEEEEEEEEEDDYSDEYTELSPDLSYERRISSRPTAFNRAASPTKSSMRSPMKGKTPGRVVEFTSSTMSPLAQAQARAERRANASPEKRAAAAPPPPPLAAPATATLGNRSRSRSHSSSISPVIEADKENASNPEPDTAPVVAAVEKPTYTSSGFFGKFVKPFTVMSSSSSSSAATIPKPAPVSIPAPAPAPHAMPPPPKPSTSTTIPPNPKPQQVLSKTQWTRDHWLRLDELLQARRQGGSHFRLALHHHTSDSSPAAAATQHHLLGKQVTAQGEAMTLEPWHLDIVDAFRREVGGWDPEGLAKRLFALMVGEERRAAGLVPRRR